MMILTTEAGTEIELAEHLWLVCKTRRHHLPPDRHLYFNREDSREVVR
jgi:hypothetical protein